ncbi:MAG: hypothetical protein WB646_01190 [Steroidobacteraceae bacterium]
MYDKALPRLSEALADEFLRALDDPQVTHWGEAHCVIEYSDAYPRHRLTRRSSSLARRLR